MHWLKNFLKCCVLSKIAIEWKIKLYSFNVCKFIKIYFIQILIIYIKTGPMFNIKNNVLLCMYNMKLYIIIIIIITTYF